MIRTRRLDEVLRVDGRVGVLSGGARMWYGERLGKALEARAGDFLYIPAGVPHLPVNLRDTEPATAVVARTDPKEQEGVVLLPELDGVVPDRIGG